MKIATLEEEVDCWYKWGSENECYDVALMKIWIQFEKFISELFVDYAIGNKSELNYMPERKVEFYDEETLREVFRKNGKQYVDYKNIIDKLSGIIFKENPFDIIISDVVYKDAYEACYVLRNYTAHESVDARNKYINKFFFGDERKYKPQNNFLKRIRKEESISNYTFYVTKLKEICRYLINPSKC